MCTAGKRRPRCGGTRAGTSGSTLVENLDCMLSSAEAMPSVGDTCEKFLAAEVASARRRSRLEARQRVNVARHDEKLIDELLLLLVLVGLLFLFGPKAHLFENKGFTLLMFREPLADACNVDGARAFEVCLE